MEEQSYRGKGVGMRFRPFSEAAGINTRGYSKALQRVICDFGADHAFGQVNKKLEEHYGIDVPVSTARKITEYHGAQMKEIQGEKTATMADIVIAESDGSMIPIVETEEASTEEDSTKETEARTQRKKKKRLCWKEARLSLAHEKGSTTPCFAGTLESIEIAGEQLLTCVKQVGAHKNTYVHCVGDGARWIADQVEEQFGTHGHYLIDFYHLCEYLAAAAPTCAPGQEKEWLEKQKEAMKSSQHQAVLLVLKPHVEKEEIEDKEAPVRACYRYIKNRPEQLDYEYALAHDLPIGSGEIESAHRYVLQKRLKIAGAWWKLENAKHMINLRVCRANTQWDNYWKKAA